VEIDNVVESDAPAEAECWRERLRWEWQVGEFHMAVCVARLFDAEVVLNAHLFELTFFWTVV